MPIDLASNRGTTATVEIEYVGERATIVYLPDAMTGEWSKELGAVYEEDDFELANSLLAEVILDWDIYDNGEKLPISGDGFDRLPVAMFSIILGAMMQRALRRGRTVRRANPIGRVFEGMFGKPGEE